MFGYIRPAKSELKIKEFEQFKACYCGLCHSLSKHYGFKARFILNYDYVFLTMLLSEGKEAEYEYRRCAASPLKKKCCCVDSNAYEIAGAHSVILSYWKLIDEINDHNFVKGIPARIALWFLKSAYKKASKTCGEFNLFAEEKLKELNELEIRKSPIIDEAADKFALILKSAARNIENSNRRESLEDLLYHTGRAIYLIDACDDLEDDLKTGAYNPLRERFKIEDAGLTNEDKKYLDNTIDHSINIMCNSFEDLPETAWTSIIKNIVYIGVPYMKTAVLSGTWKDRKKLRTEKIHLER